VSFLGVALVVADACQVPIYKPRMMLSNRCLLHIKSALGFPMQLKRNEPNDRSLRVGHGGTLDALASGVLVVGIGRGCAELQSFLKGSKGYVVKALLGATTPSLDLATPVQALGEWKGVTAQHLEAVLPRYRGEIFQQPPMYSAKRTQGVRLYRRAMKGEDVEREDKRLTVFKLTLLAFEPPYFSLAVESTGGFYVRQLVHDIGRDLGCGAVAFSITRTRQGPFVLAEALPQSDWTAEKIEAKVAWAHKAVRARKLY
jgi:tRNA pseudouridine55 synthase